jgi:hypothetical protein
MNCNPGFIFIQTVSGIILKGVLMSRYSYKHYLYGTIAVFTGAASVIAAMPMTSYAGSTLEQRKKILVSSNIMENFAVTLNSQPVSRATFARMLVRASSYNNSVAAVSNVSVFNDVPATDDNAAFIRIAAEKGWMSAFLGGQFKPTQAVRLFEAAKAGLSLLGYTDADFTGNQIANRVAKAQAIGLTDDIGKGQNDVLTYQDCVNFFYNLLLTNTSSNENKTKTSQTIYGSLLGFNLSGDNELNAMDTLSSNLKGPYLLKKGHHVSGLIPFSKNSASCFLNGATSSIDEIESEAENCATVIYYNSSTKTVYAYSETGTSTSSSSTQMAVASGNLDAIYYSSSDIMTPTSIEVDGTEYTISSTDSGMQYAFSVYGSVEVNDTITIVYQTDTQGNRTVLAYLNS